MIDRKNRLKNLTVCLIASSLVLLAVSCKESSDDNQGSAQTENYSTFENFESQAYRGADGVYVVNGDTPVENEKKLKEFYDTYIAPVYADNGITAAQPIQADTPLIVHQVNGVDAVWDSQQKQNLTYCISNNFGSNKAKVVADMASATAAWELVSQLDFIYESSQDASCTSSNNNVVFDVNPVNSGGQYLARAFFPDQSRSTRNVLIDDSSFTVDPNGTLQLVGILRHELGHTVGFRHEHTRPESGTCFEDNNWRGLTNYDSSSVMHYPQCNGTGDWSLTLTSKDKDGSACLYEAANGYTIGNEALDCSTSNPGTGTLVTQAFTGSLARGEIQNLDSFSVVSGTVFKAVMTGTGDLDLYVKFGSAPTTSSYNCRPYSGSSNETCSLDVPAGTTEAFVMVRGYAAGTYNMDVTYTTPN
ncbi:MAG: peptidase M10 [SAR324 cluster bacterium]|uniref:Peptidase M10 n=1 Tax=SAR324 cluster bacterium TaxID=2024889 RepID=A0A2A4T6Q9_9DELT|nr:MAG: peptidase M10 [SAR324 cluster bacterium]